MERRKVMICGGASLRGGNPELGCTLKHVTGQYRWRLSGLLRNDRHTPCTELELEQKAHRNSAPDLSCVVETLSVVAETAQEKLGIRGRALVFTPRDACG